MRKKGTDKYKNAHIHKEIAIEFSRRQEQEPSASRSFARLIVLDYNNARQNRQQMRKNSVNIM